MVLPRSATSSPSRCSMPTARAPLPASFRAFSGRLTMLGPRACLVNLSVSLPLICTVARGTDITVKVANMSLGGPRSQPLNDAVAAAVNMGLAVVVSAGNNNADASGFSPASEPLAYTVGSIDINDSKSNFSNFGARMIPPSPFPLSPFPYLLHLPYSLSANGIKQPSMSSPRAVTSPATGTRPATTPQGSSAEPLWPLPMSRVSVSTYTANTRGHTPPPARSPPQSPGSPPRTRWLPHRLPQGRRGLLPSMGTEAKHPGGLAHYFDGLFSYFDSSFFVGTCLGNWGQ